MSLPINPLAKLVSSVSQTISTSSNALGSGLSAASDQLSKLKVDQTVNRLSAGIGSGLNGFASGAQGALGNVQGALGGLGNPVQSAVGGAISSLQQSVGSISNVTSDIASTVNKLGIGGNLATGIASVAGAISKAAGQINNLLSLKRGANIPSGAELFKPIGKAIELRPSNGNDWRIRLNAEWSLFDSPLFKVLQQTGGVVWPYLPNITVSTKANYSQIDTIHNNYPFLAYKHSQVDEIQIAGEFSCETETDAAYWISATTFFKTVTKMFFGQGPNVGNPPPICILSGYGGSVFNNVPVIVKSFSVDFKDDINYINCNIWGTNTWVPVLSTITVSVSPIYNRERLRQFSLQDYARGGMAKGVGFI